VEAQKSEGAAVMADEGEDAPVAAVAAGFGLPEELAAVLPADPFEQLDVARKITSIALASRVGRLEAEAAELRAQLAQRDDTAEDLRERVEQLESALALATDRLSRSEDEKVSLSAASY
jgi:ferritin-like metal-binding protein YciE